MQVNTANRSSYLSRLNAWRAKVKTLAGDIFSPPYLPVKFIIFFLITNATQMAVIFMNQPLNYWTNDAADKGTVYNGSLIPTSPVEWVIFGIVYLPLAIFCLTVFNYRWSLIGWLTAEVIHLYGIQRYLTNCTFNRWSVSMGRFCESFDGGSFWVLSGLIIGLFLTLSLRLSRLAFQNKKIEKGLSRISILFSVIWITILIGGVVFSTQKASPYGWIPVEAGPGPGPLSGAEVAFDKGNNELVLFGGESGYLGYRWDYKIETWVWTRNEWINKNPAIYPSGRTAHAMAYDEYRGRVVLFGGFNENGTLADTWEWDGYTWANYCTCVHPSARYDHEMFYDPTRKKVVLYGGFDGKTEYNDAWEWDGEGCTWNKIELGDNMPIADYFTLARNSDQDYLLAYLSRLGGSPGGTWVLKGDKWNELPLSVDPGKRVTSLAYDPGHKTFLLFGGDLQGAIMNDTWLFNGKSWSQYKTKTQPPIRSDMVLWYDQARNHIMLYGGRNGDTRFNDMWEFVFPEK